MEYKQPFLFKLVFQKEIYKGLLADYPPSHPIHIHIQFRFFCMVYPLAEYKNKDLPISQIPDCSLSSRLPGIPNLVYLNGRYFLTHIHGFGHSQYSSIVSRSAVTHLSLQKDLKLLLFLRGMDGRLGCIQSSSLTQWFSQLPNAFHVTLNEKLINGNEAQDIFPLLLSAVKLEQKLYDGYQKFNHINVSSKNKSQIHISLFLAYIYNINTNLSSKYIFF